MDNTEGTKSVFDRLLEPKGKKNSKPLSVQRISMNTEEEIPSAAQVEVGEERKGLVLKSVNGKPVDGVDDMEETARKDGERVKNEIYSILESMKNTDQVTVSYRIGEEIRDNRVSKPSTEQGTDIDPISNKIVKLEGDVNNIVLVESSKDKAFKTSVDNHDTLLEHYDVKDRPKHNKDTKYIAARMNHAMGPLLALITYDDKSLHSVMSNNEVGEQVLPLVLKKVRTKVNCPNGREQISSFIKKISSSLVRNKAKFGNPVVYMLKIKMLVNYAPKSAESDHEKNPYMHMYLSQDAAIDGAQPITINPHNENPIQYSFLLKGRHIPEDAAVNFFAISKQKNSHDNWVDNQAGFVSVPLIELLNSAGDSNKLLSYKLRVPCSRHKDLDKGSVSINLISAAVQSNDKSYISGEIDKSYSAQIGEMLKMQRMEFNREENSVSSYIMEVKKLFDTHPARISSISNITVYKYTTQTGVIPGTLFDLFKIPASKEEYYLNALTIAVSRRMKICPNKVNLNSEHWMRASSDKWRTRTVMDMICVYVSYCSYVTDKADYNVRGWFQKWSKQRVELMDSFDIMRWKDFADCEDFTREILQEVMELKYNRFVSIIIRAVKVILKQFIFCSELCGVSNRALSEYGGEQALQSVVLQGHEAAFAIPKFIYYTALSRHDPDHPILRATSREDLKLGENEIIYVLEGTGKLQPEPSVESKSSTTLSSVLSAIPGPSKKVIADSISTFHYEPGGSCFYKMMIVLITPEFFLKYGLRYFGALACKIDYRSGRINRGVLFNEMVNMRKDEAVCLVPYPEMPIDVLEASVHLSRNDHPIPTLVPFNTSEIINKYKGGDMDDDTKFAFKVKEIQKRMNLRSNKAIYKECGLPEGMEHTIHVRYDLASEEKMRRLREDSSRLGLGIEAHLEDVKIREDGHKIGGFRLTFYT